jgi:ribosomal protein S18 acetylase RimI-like enzyme
MLDMVVRAAEEGDRAWIRRTLVERWSATEIAAHGQLYQADALPALVAERGGERVGLLTYRPEETQYEVVSLDSLCENQGTGTALLTGAADVARAAGARRLWLITTNDNLRALRFYQKRGMVLVAVHRNALDVSRRLKPSIPMTGADGIPLRDEIELELLL